VFPVRYALDSYLKEIGGASVIKIGVICLAEPVLTEDLHIVDKEEFSVICYMCL
jgi:hypothetical protein